jgi:hypothetical protein
MMVRSLSLAFAVLALSASPAAGQKKYHGETNSEVIDNTPYTGDFTFARIKFNPLGGEQSFFRRDVKWNHDYPRAEHNFMRILRDLTTLRPYTEGGNVFTLDDPELFKFPLAYLCEPGFWTLTDKETEGLRNYLLKGGFLIIDDFFGEHWYNFEEQMKRVLPESRLVQLDPSHPIFDAFFKVDNPNYVFRFGLETKYYGIFENNDPRKRLMVIVNYNNDVGDFWEWSDAGFFPVELTNEAYKLGVNYIVYGMSH